MTNENKKYFCCYLIVIYIFLIYGFLNGEDAIKGAKLDFYSHTKAGLAFSTEFFKTFLNYDDIGMRHSPLLYIFRSFFIFNEDIFRFLFFNLMMISIYFFYKSLALKFDIKNNLLIYFSTLITLLPTYRSYSFWPDPHLAGFLFFIVSIFFYLKFINSEKIFNKYKYASYNTIFLAISAYFSPNYGLMVIFYLFNYFRLTNNYKFLFKLLLLNFILGLPFLFYIFGLDVNFIFGDAEFNIGDNIYSLTNISNKIVLILSLLLFYQLPLIFVGNVNLYFQTILKFKILFFIIALVYILLCFNFDFTKSYNITNSGGGIIYALSNQIFSNNIFLFIFSFFSLIFQLHLSSLNKSNIILYLCLFLSHPQETLWQANFSPLLFVITFTLFNFQPNQYKNLINLKILLLYYIYFLGFYFVSNFRELFL
tara:strand:+ start:5396 stop:6664 length:1269 start_codon:yes stop_codon:yes gene_type:complete